MSELEPNNQPPTKEEEEDADGGDDAPAAEEESTANFAPVVVLEEVEVQTGEENEDVVLAVRCKLFIYGETMLDKGTGKKSWVERGVGDIRLMKNRETEMIRVLMRQEKTMKVIANHSLDPRIKMVPNVSSDRTWIWIAHDFSDGVALAETTFACRFKDSTVANDFKTSFEANQLEMKRFYAGVDAEDTAAGDEAAAALESLTTNDKQDDDADAPAPAPSEEKESS